MITLFGQNMNGVIFMSDITSAEAVQLKSMLKGAVQLSKCLNMFASQAVSPQLKDELGKLAAASDAHKSEILSMLEGKTDE